MKVRAKAPWIDETGLHKKGDIVEVKRFDPILMDMVDEPKTETKKKTTTKKK